MILAIVVACVGKVSKLCSTKVTKHVAELTDSIVFHLTALDSVAAGRFVITFLNLLYTVNRFQASLHFNGIRVYWTKAPSS